MVEPTKADWYPDPSGDYKYRYWNGQQWTEHVSIEGRALTDAGWPRPGTPDREGVVAASPGPVFEDPEDATRWRMLHALHASITEMMNGYQQCFETAEGVEKAYAMANAEFVNGIRQHEISKENFRKHAEREEGELVGHLAALKTATSRAQQQWNELIFLLPSADSDISQIANWCMAHNVSPDVFSSVISNGMFLHTDFGLTRESFWTENDRVIQIMKNAQQ